MNEVLELKLESLYHDHCENDGIYAWDFNSITSLIHLTLSFVYV